MKKAFILIVFVLSISGLFCETVSSISAGASFRTDTYKDYSPSIDRKMAGLKLDFKSAYYFGSGWFGLYIGGAFDFLKIYDSQKIYDIIEANSGVGLNVDNDALIGFGGSIGVSGRKKISPRFTLYTNIGIRLASDFEFIRGSLYSGYFIGTTYYSSTVGALGTLSSVNFGPCYDFGARFALKDKIDLCAGINGFYTTWRSEKLKIETKNDSSSSSANNIKFNSFDITPYIGFSFHK